MATGPRPRGFAAVSALVGAVNASLRRGRGGRGRRCGGAEAVEPPLEFDAAFATKE